MKVRSRLATLIIIAAVAVGAFAAGLLMHQHNATTATVSLAASTLPDAQQTTNQQTTTSAQAKPNVTYLHIKEWHVKLPLPAEIKDAYYVVSTSNGSDPDGLPSAVWLGQKSLSKSTCDPANNNIGKRGALGAILRIPPTERDAVTGQLLTQEYPSGITIDGYYYAYQSWKTDNPCASAATLQASDSAFATAAKNTAASPTN